MVDTSFLDTLYPRAPSLATQFTLYPRAPSLATQFTLYPRAPSPPEDLLPQGTLSRLAAIHLVLLRNSPCTPGHPLLQRTFSPRGPSPPEDLLSPGGDSPCLAAQFTLSCLTAIHLVNTSLYARRPRPSAIAPAPPPRGLLYGALPSPIPGLVRPTVPQACVDQLVYCLVC